jgi:chromosome partitioning protein
MSVEVLTFFNNKGGVGKTSIVYHLSWMLTEIGYRVLVCDLDPQANLTAAFLNEEQLVDLWDNGNQNVPSTIYRSIQPLTAVGDLLSPKLQRITPNLALVAGDLALSGFEDQLSAEWASSMGSTNLYRPFRLLTAFWQVVQLGAKEFSADIILSDVGPNLGAINRSALLATDYVLVPLGADLFSLQGLRNLGPTLRRWRSDWQKRLDNWHDQSFELPIGRMNPMGYVVQQHSVRLSRPVKAYDRWVNRIPSEYRRSILGETESFASAPTSTADDPYCLATLKHYRSLVPMGQEARKPIFHLGVADGAIGNHALAVKDAYWDFRTLAIKILDRMPEVVEHAI